MSNNGYVTSFNLVQLQCNTLLLSYKSFKGIITSQANAIIENLRSYSKHA